MVPHDQSLRIGMVGGGAGAFIGQYHRMALRITGRFNLVAGAFSSDASKAAGNADVLGIERERSYADFSIMAQAEAARADGIEAVAIVTPNHLHLPAAEAFLRAGLPVFCEKPLTRTLAEADALDRAVDSAGVPFAVAHVYAGYTMVRHARMMVTQGSLGTIRGVHVEYPQGWLSAKVESQDNKQAMWRTDPLVGGAGGLLGDIGTHAFHLAEYVTGLRCAEVAADLSTFVDGRVVPDDARLLLRFQEGARGMLWASQVAIGCGNALRLRIFGESASLDWSQEKPNELLYATVDGPPQTLVRGAVGMPAGFTGLPSGHPEGFVEALAQLYADFADSIELSRSSKERSPHVSLMPSIADGCRGMQFIEAALSSAGANSAWIPV